MSKKGVEKPLPIKRINEIHQTPAPTASIIKDVATPLPEFGTYCSRCGNRVPDRSVFCNRCGFQIVVIGNDLAYTTPTTSSPQPIGSQPSARNVRLDIEGREPVFERSPDRMKSDSPRLVPQECKTTLKKKPVDPVCEANLAGSVLKFPEVNKKPEPSTPFTTTSTISKSEPYQGVKTTPQNSQIGFSFSLSKQVIIGSIVVFLTIIIYVLAVALEISIIFVICLNLALIFIELFGVTKYYPKYMPYMKYAAAAGTILFLFMIIQYIFGIL